MPYDADNDPYLDETTGILRNKLGITTQSELDDAEARITTVEIAVLTTDPAPHFEDFDVVLFRNIHRSLFSELYDWAGEFRTVDISKESTKFAPAQFLAQSVEAYFEQLKVDDFLMSTDFDQFNILLARHYGDLIVLHPFREGNGRTTRTFLAMLAESIGWHIAWDEMDAGENIAASIAAYNGDEMPLRAMLAKFTTPVDVFWGRDPYEFIDLS